MSKTAAVEGHRKDKMKHLDPRDITIGQRAREDLGEQEFKDLVDSIREKGIIQPITVDTNNFLLAGGRRLSAALLLELPTVPVIIREVTGPLDAREIELMENIYRKDFTWSERARLVKQIDDLQHQIHGDNWSGRKTAALLDRGVATVSRELQLANALEVMPELGECKTADDALKVLKKLEEGAVVGEMRRRQEERMQTSADAKTSSNQFESGLRTMLALANRNYMICDVFAGMAGMQTNGNIQIIECDPPYGIDLNKVKASKESVTSNVHSYEEVPQDQYEGFLERLASELFRVAGKNCWLVFWYGPTWHTEVLNSLRKAGWSVDEIPAIWAKPQGQTLQPEVYFARGYEPFFLCRKGQPVMANRGRLNVFNYSPVPGKLKYHPTQRPNDLIKEILSTLGVGTQHVFVPFLGSGQTLLSCYELGFQGMGFDVNPEYKDKFMLEVEAQTRKLFSDDPGF